MFIKIYQYHIQKDKVDEFFDIQEKANEIYSRYLDFHIMYLKSKDDDTKWIEITKCKNEDEYYKSMIIINDLKDIQDLFEAFKSILLTDKKEIIEEDFIVKKENLFSDSASF